MNWTDPCIHATCRHGKPRSRWLHCWLLANLKWLVLLLFKVTKPEGALPNAFSIALFLKQICTWEENQRPTSLTGLDAKIINNRLVNLIQQHIEHITHAAGGAIAHGRSSGSTHRSIHGTQHIKWTNLSKYSNRGGESIRQGTMDSAWFKNKKLAKVGQECNKGHSR